MNSFIFSWSLLLVSTVLMRTLLRFANANDESPQLAISKQRYPVDASRERHIQGEESAIRHNVTYRRGIAFCAAPKMIADAHAVLDQIRNILNSSLPAVIVHCDELNADHLNSFDGFQDVHLLDICQQGNNFSTDHGTIRKRLRARLRSWFCKAAALVLAPFDEVMVIDVDTVWFRAPDVVFQAPQYLQTGAYFVRDRMSHDRADRGFQRSIVEFIERENPKIKITADYARSQIDKDGINFFWRGSANLSEPTYNNFEDSSIVVVDKTRHPRLLATITRLVADFDLGWGDKELYWIASIIAGEPYSFEPFLFSLYGQCGVIMHYDPNDYLHPATAYPLYVNGEWLVERVTSIGRDLAYWMPNAIPAAPNTPLFSISSAGGCGCRDMGCRPLPDAINQMVLRAQWERKTRAVSRTVKALPKVPRSLHPLPHRPRAMTVNMSDDPFSHPTRSQIWYIDLSGSEVGDIVRNLRSRCVPIYTGAPETAALSKMIESIIARGECGKLGCAAVPIVIDTSSQTANKDVFCLPISFNPAGPEEELRLHTLMLQRPPPLPKLYEGELIRGSGTREIYMVQKQTLRMFPSGATFIAMGFEWNQVHIYDQHEVDYMPRGDDLPLLSS